MKHHSSSSKRRSTLQMKFRVTSGFQEIGQRSLSALRNLDIRCVARILLKTQMLNRAHSLGLPIQESLDVLILENSRNHRRVQCSYCKPVSFANIKHDCVLHFLGCRCHADQAGTYLRRSKECLAHISWNFGESITGGTDEDTASG
jgi:hypothetical protein